MKKGFSVLFLFSLILLSACGTKKSDLIVGTWKFEDAIIQEVKDTSGAANAQIEAQMNAMKADMRKTYSWAFEKDGSYTASYGGTTYKGKWTMSADEKMIYTTSDQQAKADTCLLLKLDSKNLVISQKDDQGRTSKTTFGRK
jgi:hypothetical protein